MTIGKKIYRYKSVASTNTIAYRLAKEGKPEGTTVITEYQSRGMAKSGRTWISPPRKSILLSVILRPQGSPASVSKITQHVAIAVGRAINRVTGLRPEFKWPNDLILNRKKISGILTRMSTKSEKIQFVIIGIGINVNTGVRDLVENGTSLKLESGRSISRRRLMKAVLEELDKQYTRLKELKDNAISH